MKRGSLAFANLQSGMLPLVSPSARTVLTPMVLVPGDLGVPSLYLVREVVKMTFVVISERSCPATTRPTENILPLTVAILSSPMG